MAALLEIENIKNYSIGLYVYVIQIHHFFLLILYV